MPRRYYRARRTVVVRPKKRWASNMQIGQLSNNGPVATLVENSVQTSSPTPIILKVGNIKLQGDAAFQNTSAGTSVPTASIIVLVFYLPEGINMNATTASSVAAQHPEWIMAWKLLDFTYMTQSSNSSSSAFTVSSRLKRNLNSGDRICIGFLSDVSTGIPTIKYAAQYWTCSN